MKLGFKRWFSILGLLLAIIISLGIGTYFDLSILEGMTPGEGEGEETPGEEGEETPGEEGEETPVEETPVEEEETPVEEEPDMTLAEISDPESPNRKKSGQEVYKNIMNNGTTESFSLIQNF